MDTTIAKIGRILYAITILIFSAFHFMGASDMAGMVPLPGGVFWVYLTGIALLGAAVSLLIQNRVKLVSMLLGILLVIFALSIHLPGVIGAENDMSMQISMGNFLKDLAMAGAALFISGVYSEKEESSGSGD
ncbi:MAG: DoxX family protein [Balneola sp.]